MYIFLDESKCLSKNWWKFILSGLVTSLKPWTINNLYKKFLEENWIKEIWWEVKSFDKKYRHKIEKFYCFLKESKFWKNIEFIWIYAKNYFENWENYFSCLEILLLQTIKYNKIDNNPDKINIIADNLKLNYK